MTASHGTSTALAAQAPFQRKRGSLILTQHCAAKLDHTVGTNTHWLCIGTCWMPWHRRDIGIGKTPCGLSSTTGYRNGRISQGTFSARVPGDPRTVYHFRIAHNVTNRLQNTMITPSSADIEIKSFLKYAFVGRKQWTSSRHEPGVEGSARSWSEHAEVQ